MEIEVLANHILILTQDVNSNLKNFNVFDSLNLLDVVDQNLQPLALQSPLYFQQVAEIGKTINLAVSHSLGVGQTALPRAFSESVTSWLLMVSDAILEAQYPAILTALNFSQSAAAQTAKGSYSELTLSQDLVFEHTKNLTVAQTFTVNNYTVGYLPSYFWQNDEYVVEAP